MRIFIGFSRKKKFYLNPLGLLIMSFENIGFSHCYVRIDNSVFNMVYEATYPLTRFIKFDKWISRNEITKEFELDISKELQTKFIAAIYSQLGRRYSFWQLITIGLWIFTKKYIFMSKADNNERHNICTEFVANCLMTLGVQFERDADLLLLKDIYNKVAFLSKAGS